MNNEDTILNPATGTAANTAAQTMTKNNAGIGAHAAYAAGGAFVGAGLASAGQAVANTNTDIMLEDDFDEEVKDVSIDEELPNGQSAAQQPASVNSDEVVATVATNVPVAHVDDSLSFSQAFAQARAQVGPGGVFEWRGHAYHTYYVNEWNGMSIEERAEFQASIDYSDVLSDDATAQHYNYVAQQNAAQATTAVGTEQEVEVRVLDVASVDIDGDGIDENVALLDFSGNQVIIVDVDGDNMADVAICDLNGNEELDEGEMADISDAELEMPTAADIDNGMVAMNDDMPDYTNDANVELFEA